MSNTKKAIARNKGLSAWSFALLLVAAWPVILKQTTETRVYRDIRGYTPFRDVVIYWTKEIEGNLMLAGRFEKLSCNYVQLDGYITHADGHRGRAHVDTEMEDEFRPSGNRVATGQQDEFGPWLLLRPYAPLPMLPFGDPVYWEIYASHNDCAYGPETQTNLFAEGDWVTTENAPK